MNVKNKQLEVKFGEGYGNQKPILCPVCGFDYVHHEASTHIKAGQDNHNASKHVRGTVITVPMYCESGHRFNLMMGFHKGSTYFWCEYVDKVDHTYGIGKGER